MSLYLLETVEERPKGYRTFVLRSPACASDPAFFAIADGVVKRLCGDARVLTRFAYEKRPGIFSPRRTLPSVELFRAFGLEEEIFGKTGAFYTVTAGYNAPLMRLVTEGKDTVGQEFRYTAYVIDREMPHTEREVRLMHRYPDYRMRIACNFTGGSIEIALRDDERAFLFDAVRRVCAEYGKLLQQK